MRHATFLPLFLAAAPLAAQPAPDPKMPMQTPVIEAPASGNRYTMTPTDGGFLRLDSQTGTVSLCTRQDAAVQCRLAADERAALEGEIDRLRRENALLKSGTARILPALPKLDLPSEADMDKALGFMEGFMRRMMRVFREDAPQDKT